MSLEFLLILWYAGVTAIAGGIMLPLGPLRPWTFRAGVSLITAAAITMAFEYIVLVD